MIARFLGTGAVSRVWRAPAAVGAATAAGLLIALLTDGAVAQTAGCLAVGAPLVTLVGLAVTTRYRRATSRRSR